MPKIVILGACRFEPYEVLAVPEKIPELWNTEKGYQIAFQTKFKTAIEKADIVLVYAPDGIGEHTQKDIEYAIKQNKRIIIIEKSRIWEAHYP